LQTQIFIDKSLYGEWILSDWKTCPTNIALRSVVLENHNRADLEACEERKKVVPEIESEFRWSQ
jgi:hypothetical protein